MTTLTAWALLYDPLLLVLLYKATETLSPAHRQITILSMIVWMAVSKTIKLMGHFMRYPQDLLLLPVSWLFGYVHSIIKLWAMFTLHEVNHVVRPSLSPGANMTAQTAWGSRANADTGDNARMIPLPRYE